MMTTLTMTRLRAVDYPFSAPLERFVYVGNGEAPPFSIEGRQPVLALASNGSPLQLSRKFAGLPGHIPVSRAVLFDHVVVYSAHFSSYGAIPATLHQFPGGIAFVALTWLEPSQLAHMHQSEAMGVNYDYVEVEDVRLEHDGDVVAEQVPVGAYVSRHGPLLHAGQPIRLAETASSGCPLPALTQPAMLRFVHRRIAPKLGFETFLERLVEDPAFRREMTARLQRL